jgi:hypothetical protein
VIRLTSNPAIGSFQGPASASFCTVFPVWPRPTRYVDYRAGTDSPSAAAAVSLQQRIKPRPDRHVPAPDALQSGEQNRIALGSWFDQIHASMSSSVGSGCPRQKSSESATSRVSAIRAEPRPSIHYRGRLRTTSGDRDQRVSGPLLGRRRRSGARRATGATLASRRARRAPRAQWRGLRGRRRPGVCA